MSTLIPIKQWSALRELTANQLRVLKACEVYQGDEGRVENYLFTFIPLNPYDGVVADNIKTKAEYLGMSTNSIYPLSTPDGEMIEKEVGQGVSAGWICEKCGFMSVSAFGLMAHQRAHQRLAEAEMVGR